MNDGFTLIEIIVVLTIISILAITAVAHYRTPTQAVNHAIAKVALFNLATTLEEYYDQQGSYRGFNLPNTRVENFELELTEVNDHSYKICAIPKVPDECGSFSLDQNGTQTVSGPGQDCW